MTKVGTAPLSSSDPSATADGSTPRRPGPRTRAQPPVRIQLLQWGAALGSLAVMEVLSRTGVLTPFIPAPTAVVAALLQELVDPALWAHIGNTLASWAIGLGIAILIGIPAGLVIASVPFLYNSTKLTIDFIRPIPPVAILPLAVLLYGSGLQMKVFLVAFSAVWFILFQTIYGVQDVDPVARDSMKAYGLSRSKQFRHVVLPSAAFYIATGFRLAATTGLIVAVAVELIVGSAGIGFAINQERFAGNNPAMYALVIVAGTLGLVISFLLRVGEKRVLHWHAAHRPGDNA